MKNKIFLDEHRASILKVFGAVLLTFFFVSVQSSFAQSVVRYRLPLSSLSTINAWYDHDSSSAERRYDGYTAWDYPKNIHSGTDFPKSSGTSIYAGAHGELYYRIDNCPNAGSINSTCGGGFGNQVRIKHLDNKVTVYAHMKLGTPVGLQSILCGAKVGGVGSSGSATGNHLHFELWSSTSIGTRIDPFSGTYSQPTSYWVNQNSGFPSTSCQ